MRIEEAAREARFFSRAEKLKRGRSEFNYETVLN
jgi:hypothetical protein